MGVEIKEDPMPSKEEFDAIVWMAENPVHVDTDDVNVADVSVDGVEGQFEFITEEKISKMAVNLLQDELGKRGLVKRGRKQELLAWLRKDMAGKVVLVDANRSNRSRGNNTATDTVPSKEIPGLAEGSYWEELTPLTDAVKEPQN
eukprot:6611273-Ditylum_brightwellii.AAC.1